MVRRTTYILATLILQANAALAFDYVIDEKVETEKSAEGLVIVEPQEFCKNFDRVISLSNLVVDLKEGSPRQFQAKEIAANLIADLKSGKKAEYLPLAALNPTAEKSNLGSQFVSLSRLFTGVLRPGSPFIVAMDTAELKYLPFVKENSNLLLVTDSAQPLNPERAQKVALTARRLKVKIFVLWVGKEAISLQSENRDSVALAFISALTGGTFIDLGGIGNPCLTKS